MSAMPGESGPSLCTALGNEWARGPDGVLFRRAGRVVILDPDDRVLLIRGHDHGDPGHTWWFTVGGGREPGETSHDAAVREAREETGIALDPESVEGPVLTRSALFEFVAETCHQDEEFYVARVGADVLVSQAGGTPL